MKRSIMQPFAAWLLLPLLIQQTVQIASASEFGMIVEASSIAPAPPLKLAALDQNKSGSTSTARESSDSTQSDTAAVDPLAGITQPMNQIRLQPSEPDAKSPENRAAAFLPGYEISIGSDIHPLSRPRRYTICSCHNPLYFEEPDLERCGNGCGCATTAVSAAHFLSSTLMLPYQMAVDPPCECQCSYGDCRCCEELPHQRPFQCKLHATAAQMAATAGFVFLLL